MYTHINTCKVLLFISIFFFYTISAFSQQIEAEKPLFIKAQPEKKKSWLEASAGIAFPIRSQSSDNDGIGLQGATGVKIEVLAEKLFLKPQLGIRFLSTQVNSTTGPDLFDRTLFFKAGMQVQYALATMETHEIGFVPFLELNYASARNYISVKSGKRYISANPASSTNRTSIDIMKGSSVLLAAGANLQIDLFYLSIGYEAFTPKMKITDEIMQEIQKQGYVIEPVQKYFFNALTFNFGISYPVDRIFK